MKRYSIVVLSIFFLWGCDNNLQREFINDASLTPQGITRTNNAGEIEVDSDNKPIEEDTDDWRTAPYYVGVVRFEPAYPNPISFGIVAIDFVITASESIQNGLILRGYDDAGRFLLLDEVFDTRLPGAQSFSFDISTLSTTGAASNIKGLHRVYVFDRLTGELVTYGDILVE